MYVIGKEQALQFAKDNCTYGKERFIEDIERGSNRSYLDDDVDSIKSALVVDGVTELVDVYTFRECSGNPYSKEPARYWIFDYAEYCVRLLSTGRIAHPYRPNHRSDKFGLSLLHDDQADGRLKDFKSEVQQPNFIGKGTKSKLEAWFGAIEQENEEKKAYIETAKAKNIAFQEKVKAKYPEAYLHILGDGWMSECEFTVGYVKVHFTAGDDGRFYRDIRVDILAMPSTDELFK